MKLTLVVPGLFGTEKFDFTQKASLKEFGLTNLQKIASRGDCHSNVSSNFLDLIANLFGVADEHISLASVTRLYERPNNKSSNWLRADPVHLQAGSHDLGLIDAQQLNITFEEAGEFTEQINNLSDGTWEIDAPHPQRWYIKTNQRLSIKTHPLAHVVGYEIGNYFPTGADHEYWISLVNEIQMLLHHSSINRKRETRGERPVNSIWLWGEGQIGIVPDAQWTKVWSDEEVALGFAHLAKVAYSALPSDPESCFDEFQSNGNYLLVFSKGYYQVQYGLSDWRVLAKTFDQTWLASLLPRVANSQIKKLKLIIPSQATLNLSNRGLNHFWFARKLINKLINNINNSQ